MADKKTILIADPDRETLRTLKAALADEYEILLAREGSKALELSVLRYPDLIMFYRACPLIGASHFLRILRTNPRTEEVPLIILSDEPVARESVAPSFLQGVLVKPLNVDEVRAHIASVLRKAETARQVGGEAGAVSGSLDQISMADLLQIFSLNRRSGCLKLNADSQEAEVYLHDGRIEGATAGATRGEKALYRVLTWSGGRFSFIPESRAPSTSLSGSTDSLLMEGMRQGDELARLRSELPGPSALLERCVTPEGLPDGLHPVTAEIFALAEFYPRVGDLVDRATATDMEVYVALKSLIEASLLEVSHGEEAGERAEIVSQEQLFTLRSRLRRAGLAPTFQEAAKVAVLAADAEDLWQFGVGLGRLPGFVADDLERLHRLPLGSIGTLRLSDNLRLDFYVVSGDERLLPLAFGLSAGTVAAVVLGPADVLRRPLALLEKERRVPSLVVRRPGEPKVPASGKRTIVEVSDLGEDQLRRVLVSLLTEVAGTDLRGVSL